MTIQSATAIVQRLGPCRIAIDRAGHAELARELALIGCDVCDVPAKGEKSDATVGFVLWPQPGRTLGDAIRSFRDMRTLILQSDGQNRDKIERALFEDGWGRHPAAMSLGEYPSWSSTRLPEVSFYERVNRHAPRGALRRGGIEADAIIARYAMAAQHIRPGDAVLVDGAGAGDGARILLALSRADSACRVAEGKAAKPNDDVVSASLREIADHAIDSIVALEPSVPADWVARLDDYARILKYDGRIILGWKVAARGDNRLPPDWSSFIDELSERFLVETRYVQMPINGEADAPHALFPIALDRDVSVDWLIVVASANPLMGEADREDYRHPLFADAAEKGATLVDFGAAYDNPWLYRTMVQMGERLGDEMKLARLAECVIEDSRPDSADRGAAIAVLGYRILELRLAHLAPNILGFIADYVGQPLDEATPPHVRRWRISLNFLAGKLNELCGDRSAAVRCYRAAAEAEWADFSPLLATKAIAASFFEARLHLADGDRIEAMACFRRGVTIATEAAGASHAEQMGDPERPLAFYFQELAEVIDMGSQCATALANADLLDRDPGLFWRQVDTRRFGLASWARDLEKENERLRARG